MMAGGFPARCHHRPVTLFAFDAVWVESERGALLRGVTAEVPGDGVTVVVGPSGAGKSTLLRLCNRLEVPTRGRVLFRGDDVDGLDPLALRRRVGMVFQRPALFGGSVRDNLAVATPGADDGVYRHALERAELDAAFLDLPADELSGGEAQRACLARALVAEPEVLLMDEPTAALDARPREALERLCCRLAESDVPVVWVTHQLDQMRRLADHVLVMVAGMVRYSGDLGGLAAAPDPDVAAFVGGGADAGG